MENFSLSFVLNIEGNVPAHISAQWTPLLHWDGPVSISCLPSLVVQALERNGPMQCSFALHVLFWEFSSIK